MTKSRYADRPYKVGYGKPPVEHQFKNGHTRNPKGRPRKNRSTPPEDQVKKLISQRVRQRITITENGSKKEITLLGAAIGQAFLQAASGKPWAVKLVIKLVETIEARERIEYWDYFRSLVGYKAHCEATGFVPGEGSIYPDPRDIELDMRLGVGWINGPMSPNEIKLFEEVVSNRDAWIEDYEEALRDHLENPSTTPAEDVARSLDMVRRLNNLLPARMRREPVSTVTESGSNARDYVAHNERVE